MSIKRKKFKTIKVDISDSNFLDIAKKAHKKNITFNEMVCILLEDYIKRCEKSGILA